MLALALALALALPLPLDALYGEDCGDEAGAFPLATDDPKLVVGAAVEAYTLLYY